MVRIIREVGHDELPEAARALNPDIDPLAEGIFMAHQKTWVADESTLKLCEKGRRTGITWAEAQDDTLIAAAARDAGGDNVFYIGDTKDKGLEWCGYVAHFARFIEGHRPAIHEFEDEIGYEDADGKWVLEKVSGFTVKFRSGFRCSALASRPEVIRGLQGVVVIDEAAFHRQVRRVIDACNALLIWGGKIRIISTHNGVRNPFNELAKEIRAGKARYSIHRYTFDDAVANGLYERRCLQKGETVTPEGKQAWIDEVRGSYGTRVAAMKEELDAIPQEGAGKLLSIVQIEACMTRDYVVKRWTPPDEGFVDWPEAARRATMQLWLNAEIAPILDTFPKNRMTAIGGDFALRQDRSCYPIGYTAQDLVRHVPLILELWRVPYDQQKQALFFVVDYLRRLQHMILDANGNGMVLAQEARQKVGATRVTELMPNDAWHREHTPRFEAAFIDRSMLIPMDVDVRDDLGLLENVDGVGKIPRNMRTEGTDAAGGGKRHGDAAVGLMNFYAATLSKAGPFEAHTVDEIGPAPRRDGDYFIGGRDGAPDYFRM